MEYECLEFGRCDLEEYNSFLLCSKYGRTIEKKIDQAKLTLECYAYGNCFLEEYNSFYKCSKCGRIISK